MQLPDRISRPAGKPQLQVVPPSAPEPASDLSPLAHATLLAGVLAIASLIRLGFMLSGDFPLNDGGMFFQMVRDLQAHHYALPQTTTYNAAGIPFSYPPLGFYATALVNDTLPVSLLTAFRVVPFAATMLVLCAFMLFARSWCATRLEALVAMFAFALLPRTYLWLLMGGGITRAFGLFFAILALYFIRLLYLRQRLIFAAPAGVFAALTVLSHLEMAWCVVFTAALFFAAFGRHRAGLVGSVLIAVATVVLTAPWWGTVLAYHGPAPLLNAGHASGPLVLDRVIALLYLKFTGEALFPVLASLALLGCVASIARRQYLLPVWLALTLTLDLRALGTFSTLPFALLISHAVVGTLVPAVRGVARAPRALIPAVSIIVGCYAFIAAMVAAPHLLRAMTPAEQSAMAWVAGNTAPQSRVLVVANEAWAADKTSEWLPALTQRVSVATPQGAEWLPGNVFTDRVEAYRALQKCANGTGDCLETWERKFSLPFDYVYIPKTSSSLDAMPVDEHECCAGLRAALRSDPRYQVVFDGDGATIYRRAS